MALKVDIAVGAASVDNAHSTLPRDLRGGTVVALASGSQLSVAGPAAGLTVIMLEIIRDFEQAAPARGVELSIQRSQSALHQFF